MAHCILSPRQSLEVINSNTSVSEHTICETNWLTDLVEFEQYLLYATDQE